MRVATAAAPACSAMHVSLPVSGPGSDACTRSLAPPGKCHNSAREAEGGRVMPKVCLCIAPVVRSALEAVLHTCS